MTDGQCILVSGPPLWTMTRFLLLSDICGLHVVGALAEKMAGP
jgi:hypothetical protein